jgi:hypothetical protein
VAVKKRTDFCEEGCTCQLRFGEVMCVKLLPEIVRWFGTDERNMKISDYVEALNRLWVEGKT